MTALPIAVYSGLHRLGAVVELERGQWRADDASGNPLGTFTSQGEATDAVLAAARPKS